MHETYLSSVIRTRLQIAAVARVQRFSSTTSHHAKRSTSVATLQIYQIPCPPTVALARSNVPVTETACSRATGARLSVRQAGLFADCRGRRSQMRLGLPLGALYEIANQTSSTLQNWLISSCMESSCYLDNTMARTEGALLCCWRRQTP
jgi:hypothetical protein